MAGDFRPRCPTQAMDVSAPATSRITRKPLPAASRSAISSDIRNGGQRDANIDRVVSMPVVSQLGGNDTSVEPNQAPKQARSAIAERRKDSLRLGDDSRWTPFWLRRRARGGGGGGGGRGAAGGGGRRRRAGARGGGGGAGAT